MKYEKAKDLKNTDFKRFYGVKKEIFETMCEVVGEVSGQESRVGKSEIDSRGRSVIEPWLLCV